MTIVGFFKRVRNHWRKRRIRSGPPIAMARFMGCDLLVRAHEDVGLGILLGEFEVDDLSHFLDTVEEGDVVFDVGGNVGAYSVPIASRFPGARVIAFEPIPLNAALIRVSSLVNGLGNVLVIQACVTDTAGSVSLSLSSDSAYSSMVDTRRRPEVARIICDGVRLEEVALRLDVGRPTLLKIDVEGAELRVLEGARSLFESGVLAPRLVMLELYDPNLAVFGTSISGVIDLMAKWGYRPYVLIGREKVAFVPAYHNVHYNVFFKR
jgi:FkbM family methyltransferase